MEARVIRLPPSARTLLRNMWLFCTAVILVIVLLNIPFQINNIAESIQGNTAASAPSWVVAAVTIVTVIAESAGSLISLALAGVLYFKRPNEGMALFLAYFLLVIGVVLLPFYFFESVWAGVNSFKYGVIIPSFFGPFLIAFLSTFPNGRLVPDWARWLIVGAVINALISPILFIAEAYVRPTPIYIAGIMAWFALIFTGFYSQIYRYRHVSNPVERQQTKWVIYTFTISALFAFLTTLLVIYLNRQSQNAATSWWEPLINLGWIFAYSTLPISLTLAVMRYRLYEIDIIINRTLVYGALTACIAALYILVVGGLGTFFQAQGNLIIALLATGLVAVVFQPLRNRLQQWANRLIFGERDDPVEVLSRLGKQLETAVPPDDVLPMLVETIAQTLKLPYVSIHLSAEEEATIAAEYGHPASKNSQFPLTYQGEHIGRLVVAPRSPGTTFRPAEMRLLRNLARQAGAAAHAVQLTTDLQRSRQRLVTAREEERRRLRRDLHDGLGSTLAALNIQTNAVRRLIHTDPDSADMLITEFKSEILEAIADIRRVVYELRPPTLDEMGLVGAVRAYAAQCSRESGEQSLTITIDAPNDLPTLPAAVEVAAYHIVREALTNVLTHAQASHCQVNLSVNHQLEIFIDDDGLGINHSGQDFGVGLTSMRERAEELGGTFNIHQLPAGGTQVQALLPIAEA